MFHSTKETIPIKNSTLEKSVHSLAIYEMFTEIYQSIIEHQNRNAVKKYSQTSYSNNATAVAHPMRYQNSVCTRNAIIYESGQLKTKCIIQSMRKCIKYIRHLNQLYERFEEIVQYSVRGCEFRGVLVETTTIGEHRYQSIIFF